MFHLLAILCLTMHLSIKGGFVAHRSPVYKGEVVSISHFTTAVLYSFNSVKYWVLSLRLKEQDLLSMRQNYMIHVRYILKYNFASAADIYTNSTPCPEIIHTQDQRPSPCRIQHHSTLSCLLQFEVRSHH